MNFKKAKYLFFIGILTIASCKSNDWTEQMRRAELERIQRNELINQADPNLYFQVLKIEY
jgi:hypothetical protein